MDDLPWILADGESLDDALEDFAEDVANPERVKRRHDAIRKDDLPWIIADGESLQAHVFTAQKSKKIKEALLLEFGDDAESRERWEAATPEFIAEYLRSAHDMGWRKGSTFTEALCAWIDEEGEDLEDYEDDIDTEEE